MKRGGRPKVLSERRGRWLLNLYPPFLFNRIHILAIRNGYRYCKVRVARSILTRNTNGTTFGGTIFAAVDPFYSVMLWQIFARKGIRVQTWLHSASIRYLKPAATELLLEFSLDDEQVERAERELREHGRFSCIYDCEARDRSGEVCATAQTEAYIRLPREKQRARSAF